MNDAELQTYLDGLITCAHCGAQFTPVHSRNRFCSHLCCYRSKHRTASEAAKLRWQKPGHREKVKASISRWYKENPEAARARLERVWAARSANDAGRREQARIERERLVEQRRQYLLTGGAIVADVGVLNAVSLINYLPDRWRLLVRGYYGLVDGEHWSDGRLARQLGISRQAVNMTRWRAIKRLRSLA